MSKSLWNVLWNFESQSNFKKRKKKPWDLKTYLFNHISQSNYVVHSTDMEANSVIIETTSVIGTQWAFTISPSRWRESCGGNGLRAVSKDTDYKYVVCKVLFAVDWYSFICMDIANSVYGLWA